MPASFTPSVHEWLTAEAQSVYAATLHPTRQWPWLLVLVDIYGRAGHWDKVSKAFDAFLVKMAPHPLVSAHHSRAKASAAKHLNVPQLLRLPMSEAPDDDDLMTFGNAGNNNIAFDSWETVHPSPLAYAVTAYLKNQKPDKVQKAALALTFLKASLTADIRKTECPSTRSDLKKRGTEDAKDSNKKRSSAIAGKLPFGAPDPTWIESTVRKFARLGKWDLAIGALSPEIFEWASTEARESRVQHGGARGDGSRHGELERVLESLAAFLASKLELKRPAPGQVEGSRACLQVLEILRADMHSDDADTVVVDDGGEVSKEQSTTASATRREERPKEEQGASSQSPVSLCIPYDMCGLAIVKNDQTGGKTDHHQQRQHIDGTSQGGKKEDAKALQWLSAVEVSDREIDAAPKAEQKEKEKVLTKVPTDRKNNEYSLDSTEDVASSALMAQQLRPCSAAISQMVFDDMQRAWVQNPFEDINQAASEQQVSAAFALYEAGVESGAVPEDTHWASPSAGVLDLCYKNFQENQAVPLAALNLVLSDMLRKYAYGEEVS